MNNTEKIKKLNNYFAKNYGMALKDNSSKIYELDNFEIEKLDISDDPVIKKKIFDTFFKYYSVNETYFFREYLTEILIDILNYYNIAYNNTLRIWSCGCSTGCEAFSIAMLIKYFEPNRFFEIIASDINVNNLDIINAGGPYSQREIEAYKFTQSKYNELLDYLVNKYFIKKNSSYYINKEINQTVKTMQLNLVDFNADQFNSYFDIIFCRNVLFYFNDESWLIAMTKIYQTLKANGALVVSPYESAAKKMLDFFKFKRVNELKGIYYFIK